METLRTGARGSLVQLLQLGLERAGFGSDSLDGIFGNNTREAVMSFQTSQGLTADGVAGPRTWDALEPWLLGYVFHIVESGDTFATIAQLHHTTVAAIDAANPGLDGNMLRVGDRLVVPLGFSVVPTNISYSSALLDFLARGLKARYPFLGVGSIGRSIMGRPLTYFAIGQGETQVFYNASHHANEWITTPVLMKFLEEYAQSYISRGEIGGVPAAELYTGITLFLVPMVNPDGVDLVTGALPAGSYYHNQARTLARNYPTIPFPDGWKANINGVDLNLTYPAGWQQAREIKFAQGYTQPGPRDYVGRSPLSQPESRAVYEFTLNHDFALTLSYHAQGEIIYWRYLNYLPPRSMEIALVMGEVSGYSVEETPATSGYAGYKDWFILAYDRPGYTIEVGRGVSPLPLEQFDEIYRDNLGILIIGMIAMLADTSEKLAEVAKKLNASRDTTLFTGEIPRQSGEDIDSTEARRQSPYAETMLPPPLVSAISVEEAPAITPLGDRLSIEEAPSLVPLVDRTSVEDTLELAPQIDLGSAEELPVSGRMAGWNSTDNTPTSQHMVRWNAAENTQASPPMPRWNSTQNIPPCRQMINWNSTENTPVPVQDKVTMQSQTPLDTRFNRRIYPTERTPWPVDHSRPNQTSPSRIWGRFGHSQPPRQTVQNTTQNNAYPPGTQRRQNSFQQGIQNRPFQPSQQSRTPMGNSPNWMRPRAPHPPKSPLSPRRPQ